MNDSGDRLMAILGIIFMGLMIFGFCIGVVIEEIYNNKKKGK